MLTVTVGAEVGLSAVVRETSLPTKFKWTLNDKIVGNELNYIFIAKETGNYIVKAIATNDDGSHSDMVEIDVLNPEDIPFTWDFEKYSYHTVEGRKLLIKPIDNGYEHNVKYTWNVVEDESMTGDDSEFVFIADNSGVYNITAVAISVNGEDEISITRNFVVSEMPSTVLQNLALYGSCKMKTATAILTTHGMNSQVQRLESSRLIEIMP